MITGWWLIPPGGVQTWNNLCSFRDCPVSLYFHSSFLHSHLFTFNLKYIFSNNFSRIFPDIAMWSRDAWRSCPPGLFGFSTLGFKGGCFYSGNILLTIIFLINWSGSSSSLTLKIAHSWVSTLSYWDSTLQNTIRISNGPYHIFCGPCDIL